MTTGLSDKQLQDAYARGTRTGYSNNNSVRENHEAMTAKGLRAVADLAITHAEAEIHGLRAELQVAEDQANNLAGDNTALTRELDRVRLALTQAQRR